MASKWNSAVTDEMLQGAVDALRAKGIRPESIHSHRCPGAFELPHAVQLLLEKGVAQPEAQVDGIIAIGAVIRGETPHFEYVCRAVTDGVTRLSLDYGLPIGFGVLTTDTVRQAQERAGRDKGNKGAEAALAVCEMIELRFDLGLQQG